MNELGSAINSLALDLSRIAIVMQACSAAFRTKKAAKDRHDSMSDSNTAIPSGGDVLPPRNLSDSDFSNSAVK